MHFEERWDNYVCLQNGKNEVKNYKFVITIVFLLVTILDVHCACTIKMLLSCVVVCKSVKILIC